MTTKAIDELSKLKACKNNRDLAKTLTIDYQTFSVILFKNAIWRKYSTFDIPKKNGGVRTIRSPSKELKFVQTKLANLLSECHVEIEKKRIAKFGKIIHMSSHGFRKGFEVDIPLNNANKDIYYKKKYTFSIQSNAKLHVRKRFVFNIDLKDFFESITFHRIVGYFIKNENFNLSQEVAVTLAQISTYRKTHTSTGFLPQGSPCSPVITNLILGGLDHQLTILAKENRCTYSRYADDITFSTNEINFPCDIATLNNDKWGIGQKLEKIIERGGFQINQNKTRMRTRKERQVVTGLVVNEKLNINADYYRATRAMVNEFCKTGSYTISRYHVHHAPNPEKSKAHALNGILNYINQVKFQEFSDQIPEVECGTKALIETIDNQNKIKRQIGFSYDSMKGFNKLYIDFLFHKNFVHHDKVKIICEGYTDIVHFKHVYKCLYGHTPSKLVFKSFNKKDLLCSFLNLDGGTENLKKFTAEINCMYKTTRTPFGIFPVVIIVDNDAAGRGVIEEIKKIYKVSHKEFSSKLHPDCKFHHIFKNFFILALPLTPVWAGVNKKNDTCIEQLYNDRKLLETTKNIGGKDLVCEVVATESQKTKKEYYSKRTFFDDIITPKTSKLDLSYFEKVFDIIKEISEDYDSLLNQISLP